MLSRPIQFYATIEYPGFEEQGVEFAKWIRRLGKPWTN